MRRTLNAFRALSVLPHGQDANDVLRSIIDHVITAAVDGVDGIDPFWNYVRSFIDLVALFGDYPDIASVYDCLGHVSNEFCTI